MSELKRPFRLEKKGYWGWNYVSSASTLDAARKSVETNYLQGTEWRIIDLNLGPKWPVAPESIVATGSPS